MSTKSFSLLAGAGLLGGLAAFLLARKRKVPEEGKEAEERKLIPYAPNYLSWKSWYWGKWAEVEPHKTLYETTSKLLAPTCTFPPSLPELTRPNDADEAWQSYLKHKTDVVFFVYVAATRREDSTWYEKIEKMLSCIHTTTFLWIHIPSYCKEDGTLKGIRDSYLEGGYEKLATVTGITGDDYGVCCSRLASILKQKVEKARGTPKSETQVWLDLRNSISGGPLTCHKSSVCGLANYFTQTTWSEARALGYHYCRECERS